MILTWGSFDKSQGRFFKFFKKCISIKSQLSVRCPIDVLKSSFKELQGKRLWCYVYSPLLTVDVFQRTFENLRAAFQ